MVLESRRASLYMYIMLAGCSGRQIEMSRAIVVHLLQLGIAIIFAIAGQRWLIFILISIVVRQLLPGILLIFIPNGQLRQVCLCQGSSLNWQCNVILIIIV